MVSEEYIEAVLSMRAPDEWARVEQWLGEHGLRSVSLSEGRVLVQGDRQTLDAAFSVDLQRLQPPVSLPIPDGLAAIVESIIIPAPRSYH